MQTPFKAVQTRQDIFDYKAAQEGYKLNVLDPAVAQYVRENPETNIEVIAQRFGMTDSTLVKICRRQGVKRKSGRRPKAQ